MILIQLGARGTDRISYIIFFRPFSLSDFYFNVKVNLEDRYAPNVRPAGRIPGSTFYVQLC